MKTSLSFFVPLLAAAYVQAHGFVNQITIDGKAYNGNVPNGKTSPSIIRQISHTDPVKGAKNKDVNCGPSAQPASLSAPANPGSKLTFSWKAGSDFSKWPHNTGPMLTYMASCGSAPCDKFDAQTAEWFKIQEVGRDSDGNWDQANTLFAGKPAAVTLPSNLAPGNYMIRHEIIALHLAETNGGAEFYPSCAQLTVGGSGTGKPASSDLVSLPGAYSDTDPGILDKDAFNAKATYVFPGPKLASFIGGSSNGNGNSSPTSSGSKPASTKGSCHLKKGSQSNSTKSARSLDSEGYYPHRISRVMRDLFTS